MPNYERATPSKDSNSEVETLLSKHAGLRETLAAWTTIDFDHWETASKAPLSVDQVVDIVISDPKALEAARFFLGSSSHANGRDNEAARNYLDDLAWGIVDKLLANRNA